MGKRYALWGLAIALAALLYVFGNSAGTLTVLLAVLLMPPLAMLPPLLCRGRQRFRLHVPEAAAKGGSVEGSVQLQNDAWLPTRVKLTLVVRNCRTGEVCSHPLERTLLPRSSGSIRFSLACPHCGKLLVRVQDATLCDAFALLSLRLTAQAEAALTVLPTLFAPELLLTDSGMVMPESAVYSTTRPGSDPGETFAIREYVPGDAIRQMHWKLSEKTGKPMVREFGLPVVRSVLLLLETTQADPSDAARTDAVTEVFASLSSALLRAGCPHQAVWSAADGTLTQHSVATPGNFDAMLDNLLAQPPRLRGSIAGDVRESAQFCGYAHIVVTGEQLPHGLSDLQGGNRVTALLCGAEATDGLQADGVWLLSFPPDGYAGALARLEV